MRNDSSEDPVSDSVASRPAQIVSSRKFIDPSSATAATRRAAVPCCASSFSEGGMSTDLLRFNKNFQPQFPAAVSKVADHDAQGNIIKEGAISQKTNDDAP